MSDQFSIFSNFTPVKPGSWPVKGIGATNQPLQALGKGDIRIRSRVNGVWYHGSLNGVIYVPDLGANLFSVRSATKRGFQMTFSGETATISSKSKIVATGTSLLNNLYKLDIKLQDGEIQPEAIAFNAMSSSHTESIHTWHQRLGHVSLKNWKKMQASDMVQGLYIKKAEAEDDLFCEGSIYGKHHRLPFPSGGRTRATRIGGLFHSDLVGPMSIPSVRGSKYFLVFKDDYSCYSQIHFIKKKTETADPFKQYAQRMEVVTGN